jgi:hypothetical protein
MRDRAANRTLAPWLALAATLLAPSAVAQNTDAPRPPRIIDPAAPAADSPPAPQGPTTARPPAAVERPFGLRPPNAARLAPLPEERADAPEEIIVIGQGWRLPDLGSEWRARQKEAENEGRFSATLLPLYDPAEPTFRENMFTSPERRRHGYIEMFRLRFGRRSRD